MRLKKRTPGTFICERAQHAHTNNSVVQRCGAVHLEYSVKHARVNYINAYTLTVLCVVSINVCLWEHQQHLYACVRRFCWCCYYHRTTATAATTLFVCFALVHLNFVLIFKHRTERNGEKGKQEERREKNTLRTYDSLTTGATKMKRKLHFNHVNFVFL